jgi:hypothetical protein
VRISAQLIRASDGFHVWSKTHDRTFDETVRVQSRASALNALQRIENRTGWTRRTTAIAYTAASPQAAGTNTFAFIALPFPDLEYSQRVGDLSANWQASSKVIWKGHLPPRVSRHPRLAPDRYHPSGWAHFLEVRVPRVPE